MGINHDHIKIGTVVMYDGQIDATYAVIGIDRTNQWNPYRLLDTTDFTITTSDMNQPRWEIIAN
jgi:hypothetical protein